MSVQVIMRDGEPEYAVLPWVEYQQLIQAAQLTEHSATTAEAEQRVVRWADVAKLREQAGFDLTNFARELGISPSYWQMIEAGERQASDVVLRTVCRLLQVDHVQ